LQDHLVVLEARGISKSYGDERVLDQVTLVAEAGEIVALLGPNGSVCRGLCCVRLVPLRLRWG